MQLAALYRPIRQAMEMSFLLLRDDLALEFGRFFFSFDRGVRFEMTRRALTRRSFAAFLSVPVLIASRPLDSAKNLTHNRAAAILSTPRAT
jgi:hypothetical protein